jgi:hypothetical protein
MLAGVLALACGCACGGKTSPRGDQKMPLSVKPLRVTATELDGAIALAEQVIAAKTPVAGYQLTSAISMVAGNEYRGPAFWRLKFKRRDLIPADAESELGAGGEIIVDVDTATGVATIIGYGE